MALTKVDDRGLKTPIDLLDNEKIRLGTGNDLELYHNGSNSIIDSNTGNLEITTDSFFVNNAANNEVQIKAVADGAVELYHDNSKKLETTSSGVTVTGTLEATTYVAVPDQIYHVGDADTAIRFPAADTIALETAGSERFRVDSSGRVMIGTTTEGNGDGDDLTIATSGRTGMTIRSADDDYGNIFFSDSTSGASEYVGKVQYYHADNSMRFATNSNDRLIIDSSGRVLIGTDTAGDANGDDLTVAGSGHSGITIRSGTSSTSQLMFTDSTSGAGSYTGIVAYRHASDSMGLFTNTAERLTINSSGQVSIGTTTASSDTDTKLRVHVPISSSTDDVIELSHNTNGANKAGGSFGLSIANGGEATNAADLTFSTASGGSLGERMRLNSNGALCIGTTSEHNTGKKLAISSTDHAMEIQLTDSNNVRCMTLRHGRASGGTGGEQITFENSDGSSVGTIESTGSATTFNTSSDYRLKENITAISDGITRLKTLKPSRFNFKVDKDTTVDGFLAHEVTAVPEAIKGTKDEVATTDDDAIGLKKGDPIYQRIDQSKLIPLLTAALQEAITKIETLETKVAALEAK